MLDVIDALNFFLENAHKTNQQNSLNAYLRKMRTNLISSSVS